MGQGLAEQMRLPEAVTDDLLAIGQRLGDVVVGSPRHDRTNKAPNELRCET